MVTSYRRSGAVRTSLTLLGQNIGNTMSIVGYTFSVSYPVFFVAKSIWPRRRRPNQTSIKSSAMGLRPTDQPPKLVLRKNGRPLLKRPASGARRRRRFCVRAARSNTRLEVLSLATSPCRRKNNSRILRGPQDMCASFRRTISHTSSSVSCLQWLLGRRDSSSIPAKPLPRKRSFHL